MITAKLKPLQPKTIKTSDQRHPRGGRRGRRNQRIRYISAQRYMMFLFLLPPWRQESYVRALRPTPLFTWRWAPHSCERTCIFMDASVCAFMCLWALQDCKCCLCESKCIGTSTYSSPGSSGILRFQFCLNRFVVQLHLFTLPLFFIVFGNWTHLHISIFVGTVIDTLAYPAPYHNPNPDPSHLYLQLWPHY